MIFILDDLLVRNALQTMFACLQSAVGCFFTFLFVCEAFQPTQVVYERGDFQGRMVDV